MSEAAAITVCVPVWNGEAHLAETLESLRRQTFRHFRALISDDASTDGSVAIARGFTSDPRFLLMAQRQRRGWVGNTNLLLRAVDSPCLCILPHDDLLAPEYLETLLEAFARAPSAAIVYADLELFGDLGGTMAQDSLLGGRPARACGFLTSHLAAVAFRGIVRTELVHGGVLLREKQPAGYLADSLWLLDLALHGELERIPAVLYRKRMESSSTHRGWATPPAAWQLEAWAGHCADCLTACAELDWSPAEEDELRAALLHRLLQRTRLYGPVPPAQLGTPAAEQLLDALSRALSERGLDSRWQPEAANSAS